MTSNNCRNLFDYRMGGPHLSGKTLTPDTSGYLWCEQCSMHRDLMNRGKKKGFPAMSVESKAMHYTATIREGGDAWLAFTRTSGSYLVELALSTLTGIPMEEDIPVNPASKRKKADAEEEQDLDANVNQVPFRVNQLVMLPSGRWATITAPATPLGIEVDALGSILYVSEEALSSLTYKDGRVQTIEKQPIQNPSEVTIQHTATPAMADRYKDCQRVSTPDGKGWVVEVSDTVGVIMDDDATKQIQQYQPWYAVPESVRRL